MKRTLSYLNKRLPALSLGCALILAATALAFRQTPASKRQPKTTSADLAADERPVSREAAGRASFAPVVKKVSPGVVKNAVTAKMQKTKKVKWAVVTENASDQTTLLRVWREGGSRFVVVDESKAG